MQCTYCGSKDIRIVDRREEGNVRTCDYVCNNCGEMDCEEELIWRKDDINVPKKKTIKSKAR